MGYFVPPDPDKPDPAFGPVFGPHNLNLEWTVRNTSNFERTEVLTIPAHFPEGNNGVMPVNLSQYSFKLKDDSTTYHTSWTVLTTWKGGSVRFAKGYITFTIDGSTPTVPSVSTLQLVKAAPGGSSYSEHANAEFDLLQSDLVDIYDNYYTVDMLDVSSCEESEELESNDHMKVYFRRTYHPDPGGGTSLGREFFSLTWYLYIPTQSRFAQLEVRLGNDFQGEDDYPESGPDPNLRPLGAMGFKSWRILYRSTYSKAIVENQDGFAVEKRDLESPNIQGWTLADDTLMKTSKKYQDEVTYVWHDLWWGPGSAAKEYLADGASIARNFFFYFKGGSPTGDEANTWSAIQDHPLCAVQTLESISKTKAAGIYHANYGYPTDPTTLPDPTVITGTTKAHFLGHADYLYDDRRLNVKSGSMGSRGGAGNSENNTYETRTGGNPRGGMDECYSTYFSGHWKHVRFYYLNGIQSYMRPGRVLWNIKIHHEQSKGAKNINFDLTQHSPTGLPFVAPRKGPGGVGYGSIGGGDNLNRYYRKAAHARGKVTATNGLTKVTLDLGGGLDSSRFKRILEGGDPNSFTTDVGGTNDLPGLRRIFIDGDTQSRIVTHFDETKNPPELTIDVAYGGSTGSGKRYVLCNDPADADYSKHRLNAYDSSIQWGITAENATHGANDCAFEGWQLTGSWMLLDNIRHCAEMFMGAYRDDDEVGVYKDSQVRACAWPAKYILQGYIATKHLLRYRKQTCAARYKEALLARHERLRTVFAPTGEYKEERKGRRGDEGYCELKDCVPYQGFGSSWAWGGNSRMGQNLGGGESTFTKRFGRSYYACIVHQVGYWSHVLWAIWLELRLTDNRCDEHVRDMAEGASNFMLDFAVVYDSAGEYAYGYMPSLSITDVGHNYYGFLDRYETARVYMTFNGPNLKYQMRFGPENPQVVGGYTQDPVKGECIDKMHLPVKDTYDPLTRASFVSIDPNKNGTNEMGTPHSPMLREAPNNDPKNMRHYNPPDVPEAFLKNNDGGGYGASAFCAGSFGLAFRYHRNADYRIRCGDVMKRWFDYYVKSVLSPRKWLTQFDIPSDGGFRPGPTHAFDRATDLAPMLGDYPFDAEDPAAGWWNPDYLIRQKLSCDTSHSGYATNDVIRVQLPANVISNSLSPAYYDVRVVHQKSDRNFEEVGRAVNVKPSSGDVYINFSPFVTVAPGADIGAQSEYSYYLYYYNVSPNEDPPAYVNTVSIDGPFSSDVDTVILWNMEGSLYNDLGQYGLVPAAPYVGYSDGPFGGAAVFNGVTTLMVAYTHDKFIPAGNFSIDMQVYVAAAHLSGATDIFTLMTRWGTDRPLYIGINPTGAGGNNEIIADFRMSGNIVRLTIPSTDYNKDTWFNLSYKFDGNSLIGSIGKDKKVEVTTTGTLDGADDDPYLWVGVWSIFNSARYTGGLAEIRWSDTDRDLRTVATKMTVTFGKTETDIVSHTQSVDADGAVEVPDTSKPIDSQGYLRIENLYKQIDADGIVADAKEMAGLDADGAVQVPNLFERLRCDGLITGTGGQKYVKADGVVAIVKTDSITSDGIVGEAGLVKDLLTDGVLATIETKPIDADGAVQEVDVGKPILTDGCLKIFDLTESVTSAGYLKRFDLSKVVATDGAIQEANAEELLQTDGCLKALDLTEYLASVGYVGGVGINKVLATDGTVALVGLKPITADGAIQSSGEEVTVLCDAHVIAFLQVTSDGAIQITFSKSLASDACLKVIDAVKAIASDGAVAFPDSKTVAADGTVALIYQSSVDADGTVAHEDSKSIYCDGFVEDPYLTVTPVTPITITPVGRQG